MQHVHLLKSECYAIFNKPPPKAKEVDKKEEAEGEKAEGEQEPTKPAEEETAAADKNGP